jgi:hypothetical protein
MDFPKIAPFTDAKNEWICTSVEAAGDPSQISFATTLTDKSVKPNDPFGIVNSSDIGYLARVLSSKGDNVVLKSTNTIVTMKPSSTLNLGLRRPYGEPSYQLMHGLLLEDGEFTIKSVSGSGLTKEFIATRRSCAAQTAGSVTIEIGIQGNVISTGSVVYKYLLNKTG